jgi:hypothetical protein
MPPAACGRSETVARLIIDRLISDGKQPVECFEVTWLQLTLYGQLSVTDLDTALIFERFESPRICYLMSSMTVPC